MGQDPGEGDGLLKVTEPKNILIFRSLSKKTKSRFSVIPSFFSFSESVAGAWEPWAPALISQPRVMLCVPWTPLPALSISFQPVSTCSISFGFGKWGFFYLAGSIQQPVPFAVPHELIGQWEERACLVGICALLKPQFTQVLSTQLALQEGRSVLAAPGPMWYLPFPKSFIRFLLNGDLRMEATENEKIVRWSSSFHEMGLPSGWKHKMEVRVEEVWFCRARTHAGWSLTPLLSLLSPAHILACSRRAICP